MYRIKEKNKERKMKRKMGSWNKKDILMDKIVKNNSFENKTNR